MNDDDILIKYVMNKRQMAKYEPVPVIEIDGIKFVAAEMNGEYRIYLLAPTGEYKGKYLNIDCRFAAPFITAEIKQQVNDKMICFDDEMREFF